MNEAELQSKIAESSSDPIKPENIWYDNDEQVSESVSILELECDPNTVQDEVSCESSVIINESSEVVSDNAGSSSQGPGEVDTPVSRQQMELKILSPIKLFFSSFLF